MKNKKLLTILGLTAIAANLGYASLVNAQGSTTGEVNVGCANLTGAAAVNFTNLATTISFPAVTYGATATNLSMANASAFGLTVSDDRGYDASAGEACGNGWGLTIDSTQTYFTNSGDALSTSLLATDLTIQQTGWAAVNGGLITATSGNTTGVINTNISGSAGDHDMAYNSPYTILAATEAFLGTVDLTFAATSDDFNLDIPTNLAPGTYTLPLTLTFTAA